MPGGSSAGSHPETGLAEIAIEEGFLATKAEIRAAAKALCFRACTDCKSADECDPDENWIEEALVTLERAGLRRLVDGQKVAFDTQ